MVKSQEEVAKILADGMCAGRVIIPTHEEGWEIVKRRGAAPERLHPRENGRVRARRIGAAGAISTSSLNTSGTLSGPTTPPGR